MVHYVNKDAPNAIWFGTFYRYKWVYLFSQVANFHAFGCARFLYLPPVHKHFHCMLIKFTHKAPHTIYLYVCFRTIPGSTMLDTKMLLRLFFSRSLSVSLYLSIANDDLRICENHKYWICVRVARRFSLSHSMNPQFYIHICTTFCISLLFPLNSRAHKNNISFF